MSKFSPYKGRFSFYQPVRQISKIEKKFYLQMTALQLCELEIYFYGNQLKMISKQDGIFTMKADVVFDLQDESQLKIFEGFFGQKLI